MNNRTCRLPGGYVDSNGSIHSTAGLKPLSGSEEEMLSTMAGSSSAARVTAIITRCVTSLGEISPVTEEIARNLCVADRQFLMLQLRILTFGCTVQTSIPCPWPFCNKGIDINFSLNQIPVKQSSDKGPHYTMTRSSESTEHENVPEGYPEITFRLPTGADQEAIADIITVNEAAALTELLNRCLITVGGKSANPETVKKLSAKTRLEIEKAIFEAAPYVDFEMNGTCPECGRQFCVPFNLQDFFFGELRINEELLYREVHYLAYHYHWSEQEIMGMPKDKRRHYIEVLAEEIEKINNECTTPV